ncbi:MAG: Smr/MutS family protein [Rhodobacteraceae bacterium]|jgi:DNA-nicking Smr family endonuclease|nr:Smr/MutS family protein [Paracoccaceae bacterium]
MSRKRHLHPDEQALWQTVARTARPLHKTADLILPDPVPGPRHPPVTVTAAAPLPLFSLGEKARTATAHRIAPDLATALATAPLQMDAKAFGKMTRGKLAPEARIDLHGMTLAEAHPELIRFVLNAHANGLRLVLVISGKGKRREDIGPIPQRVGALRHQVPQWLRLPPVGPVVLQVTEAHLRHGGSGAYYVYLRRRG